MYLLKINRNASNKYFPITYFSHELFKENYNTAAINDRVKYKLFRIKIYNSATLGS